MSVLKPNATANAWIFILWQNPSEWSKKGKWADRSERSQDSVVSQNKLGWLQLNDCQRYLACLKERWGKSLNFHFPLWANQEDIGVSNAFSDPDRDLSLYWSLSEETEKQILALLFFSFFCIFHMDKRKVSMKQDILKMEHSYSDFLIQIINPKNTKTWKKRHILPHFLLDKRHNRTMEC